MTTSPKWLYDEFKHIGVDFDDVEQVERYDARQKTSLDEERTLVARLGIQSDHTVLEYGSGTGAFAIAAGETGARVVAVDISGAMLTYATHKADQLGLESVQFKKGGYLTHSAPPESADFIVSKFAFHHLPDFWKVQALRRMWHALKPGGRLYLQDVVFSFEPDNYVEELEQWIDGATRGESFSRSEFELHIRNEYSTYGFLMEQILRGSGFRIRNTHYYSRVQAEYLCEK